VCGGDGNFTVFLVGLVKHLVGLSAQRYINIESKLSTWLLSTSAVFVSGVMRTLVEKPQRAPAGGGRAGDVLVLEIAAVAKDASS